MKLPFVCVLLLALLVACRVVPPPAPVATTIAPVPKLPWAATIADSLYARQILNAAGRDTLKQRIATQALAVRYSVPGREAQYVDTLVDPATVLDFCADLFQQELLYRLDMSSALASFEQGKPVADSARQRQKRRFEAVLQRANGDTTAALRQFMTPAQLIETHIKAEDSLVHTGWTIYPPLSAMPTQHGIAESRSAMGRTRTRTARDYYALGLLTDGQYATLRRELAANELADELAVTQRAAQLALDSVVYPVRRQVLDSLLTRLSLAGVLPPGGQAQALANPQVARQFDLLSVLPYCAHGRLFRLDSLPANPQQRYARLLAEVAHIWPTFRYTDVRMQVRARRRYRSRELLATMTFRAGGRRYATTSVLDYDLDVSGPPTKVRQRPLHYLPDEFVTMLNQYLRDQRSPMRLYLAAPEDDPSLLDMRSGLLLLTPEQRAAWGPARGLLDGPPQPDTLFTSARIEQALGLYQRLGLLAGLSPAEMAYGREQAFGGTVGSYAALLACFPHLVVYTGGEDAEQPQAYAHALREVAAATRGAFRPTHIRDTFAGEIGRKQHSALSFVAGGRTYRINLTSDLGWMINDFTSLVQRAVRETSNGQLYYLGYGDENGLYVFLTTTQAAALRRAQPALFREHDAEVVRIHRH